jgi:Co/Zn/Cd efflux system component
MCANHNNSPSHDHSPGADHGDHDHSSPGHIHEHGSSSQRADPRYRRILWIALLVNGAMFALEIGAGMQSASAALLADAIDFLGDTANYALSLWVLGMALAWRSRAALLKGASMLVFGLFVLARVGWGLWLGVTPEPVTMGSVGALALVANLGVAALLYAYRDGDANMRSVWLCTRNDAIGNLAVMGAALGVFGTGAAWPDLLVASTMAWLAVSGGWSVIRHARQELAGEPALGSGTAH